MAGPTALELTKHLSELLDPHRMPDVCPNGLQVDNTGPLSKIATAVTVTHETITKAADIGAEALIVHHGLFRTNNTTIIVDGLYKKMKLLIECNIALVCYHLPLDAHHELGNNWRAARDLGLTKLEEFCVLNNTAIGAIGEIPSTHALDFQQKLETYYGNTAQAVITRDPIRRVAIVSGNSNKFFKMAITAGADCFVSGTIDEPVWDLAHEEQVTFFALGHNKTETVGVKALAEYITNHLKIPATFISTNNPY